MSNVIRTVKDRIKYATIAAPLFEQIGITYMGIVDGNNTEAVSRALEKAKTIDGPVLIHTYTKKGMGFTDAEQNPSKFHGVSSDTVRLSPKDISYDEAFSSAITSIAQDNQKVVAVTAAMESGCGLSEFSQKYPQRFYDVGIAEEHAVTMAAGFASSGYTPVVCLYSTFLQRTYDQIVHDVCLQNLHVVFAVGHAGLTGEDGETHQGLLDLSMLCHIPNMTVLAPSSYDELKSMITYAVNECTGPVAVRYPKAGVSFRECKEDLHPTKAEILKEGTDILLLSCGRMADTALKVAELSNEKGMSVCAVNVRCVKPFDKKTIENLALGKKMIVTLEDNITDGGMGQYITSHIEKCCSVMHFGFSTCFVGHGKQTELFKINGFDPETIVDKIYENYMR